MDIGNRTLSMVDLQKNTLVSGNKAMQMLELSRHSFEKVVKDGLLTIIYENGKKYYQIGEIEAFTVFSETAPLYTPSKACFSFATLYCR